MDKQEYTLRVSPSTAKIRSAKKKDYYAEMRNAPDFDGQAIYCDMILSLHMDWLSLFILSENKVILNEMLVILNDIQTIFERMAGTLDFDLEKAENCRNIVRDIVVLQGLGYSMLVPLRKSIIYAEGKDIEKLEVKFGHLKSARR